MKTIVALLCSCVFLHAQGTLNFYNRGLVDPDGFLYNAIVSMPDGTGPGDRATAGLFLVNGNSLSLLATSPFRTGPTEEDRKSFIGAQTVTVPGIPPGGMATFRVRVWETAAGSYENAIASGLCYGEFPTRQGNNEITVRLGIELPPNPNPNLDGLLPLTLTCIPEPSTLSLAFSMGVILIASRKRIFGCN